MLHTFYIIIIHNNSYCYSQTQKIQDDFSYTIVELYFVNYRVSNNIHVQ